MRKGAFVSYALPYLAPLRVKAIVRRSHRDGTATVEARFVVRPDGTPRGGYLGYQYRLPISILTEEKSTP